MTYQYIDTGMARFQDTLRDLDKLRTVVGYFDSDGKSLHPESEVSVAKIAAIHEFGWDEKNISERSFLRSTIREQQEPLTALSDREYTKALLGEQTAVDAASRIGEWTVAAIRTKLSSAAAWADPIKPATAEEKGTAVPLVETQTLIENLGWKVMRDRDTLARGK